MAIPWKSYRFLFKKLSKTQHVSGVFVDVEVNVDGGLVRVNKKKQKGDEYLLQVYLHQIN